MPVDVPGSMGRPNPKMPTGYSHHGWPWCGIVLDRPKERQIVEDEKIESQSDKHPDAGYFKLLKVEQKNSQRQADVGKRSE